MKRMQRTLTLLLVTLIAAGLTLVQMPVTAAPSPGPLPSASVSDVAVAEGNSGVTQLTFTVTLSQPSSRVASVQYRTADGSAVAPFDYASEKGTLRFPAGDTQKTITVEVVADTIDEVDEIFYLNLIKGNRVTLADSQAIGTINDDDAAPTISIGDSTVTEGNSGTTAASFLVSLSGPSGKTATVTYGTANGTANSSDYTGISGTLTFNPGETAKALIVQVNGDTVDEGNETFFVNLTSPSNATLVDSQGLGTIVDNDPTNTPTISIADATITEGTGGSKNLIFTLTLSNQSASDATVQYASAAGTANSTDDFTAVSGLATIIAGQTTTTVTVPIITDARDEPDETFYLNLSGATGGDILDPQAVGTINDDDGGPSVYVSDVEVAETESDVASFSVTLGAPSGKEVRVSYQTANGSAVAGSDYTYTEGQLIFASGQTAQTVSVIVRGDSVAEAEETFFLNIYDAINATVSDSQGLATITDNDSTGPAGAVFTESLGGILIGGPDAASWADGRMDVFVIGGDSALWQRSFSGGSWGSWGSLGGRFTADPTAVSWEDGRIDVFGRGGDNALWHASFSGGVWSGWESLGGVITSGPDVASWGPGRLDVFARGGDNAVWRRSWNGGSWSGWESLGGIITSDPTAVSWGLDRIDIFARGGDNALWGRSWNGSSWSDWSSLGGILIGGPDATSTAENRLEIFVIGGDDALWTRSWTGVSWTDWSSWGGIYTSDPSAVSMNADRLDVYGRGGDNALWHKWQDGSP